MSDWPFDGLTPGKYRVALLDPPWKMSMGTKGRPQHYRRMTDAELVAMAESIRLLAHPDGCAFFVWMCSPMFWRSFRVVIQGWRLRYSCRAFVWIKTRRSLNGQAPPLFIAPGAMHVGHGLASTLKNAEDCYLFKIGRPKRQAKNERELIFSPPRQHSRKPDEQYDRIERLFPGPYVELFSRTTRPSWDSWGNEKGKFDGASTDERRQERDSSETGSGGPPGRSGETEEGR